MKKSKLLLPILTVASTAAVVTPFITSCSLGWKPSASSSHEAFSGGQYIGYTSCVEPAAEKQFIIHTKTSLIADLEEVGKAAAQEIKTNPAGILDDIMIDITSNAQDVSYFITNYITSNLPDGYTGAPTQYPTRLITSAAVYDAVSYKIIPAYGADILFYLNFDFKFDLFASNLIQDPDGTPHNATASITVQCRNVPFTVEPDYSTGLLTIYFDPYPLAFTTFNVNANVVLNVEDTQLSASKYVELTDLNQFVAKENLEIVTMLAYFFSESKALYHFQNWEVQTQ